MKKTQNKAERLGRDMNLINLQELIKYHPYHVSTFANFADVTLDLLVAALEGEEELTRRELFNVAKYTGISYSVLSCPKMIALSKDRYRHWQMMEELSDELLAVLNAGENGDEEAITYLTYKRSGPLNLIADFKRNGEVTYSRYLGIKAGLDQCMRFMECKNRKPRGRRNV